MREAARAVLAAVAAGAASWDCAVVVPHGDDVERAAAALEAAGLPGRLPPRRPLRRAAAAAAPGRLSGAAGRRAVRAARGRRSAERGASARFQSRRRARSLCGSTRPGRPGWSAASSSGASASARRRRGLERRLADLEARGAGPRPPTTRSPRSSTPCGCGSPRRAAWRPPPARSARACGGLPSRAAWGAWAGAVGGVAEALFEAPVAAAVRDAVGRLAALDVLDEEVDVGEMTSALREQLADARVPQGRVGRDGVAVLTPLEIRGLRFHTVVFTGLAEGGFPTRGRPDPLLGDAAASPAGRGARRRGCRSPSRATRSRRCCSPSPARRRESGSRCSRRAPTRPRAARACRRGCCCVWPRWPPAVRSASTSS